MQKLKMTIAWAMPHWLVELCTVRVFANATTGEFSNVEAPSVTYDQAMRAWRQRRGGDGTFKLDTVKY